ncbi:manganese superoxide dismutase [Mycena metata]|uniref:Manganese superoxide dismutase n=1 Tax=Mycena metata TaxID=1033252 RepID=A0AAD7NZM5_9AGAR|nr:manganese superoxide dismutase [Mycena metata]
MSFLWRCRHSLIRARRPLIPRGTRGVVGQFNHLPLPLPYDIKDGLGEFLPPPALEAVAMEYQLGLLARLTDEVRETEEEDSSVTQVIIKTAPFREKTLAFNYASLALNNSFFLGQLTPNVADSQESAMSDSLDRRITTDHGGLEQFKSTFSAAAMGMFTSGWIWFVTDKSGSTTILPTLGPGTLLVRSRTYMADLVPNSTLYWPDMMPSPLAWDRDLKYVGKYLQDWGMDGRGNVPLPLNLKKLDKILSTEPPSPPPPTMGSNAPLQSRFMHTSARQSTDWNVSPSSVYEQPAAVQTTAAALNYGEVLYPLFCISVQEHAWLTAGYGVWGKEAWLREFWNVLNWRLVSDRYATILSSSSYNTNV